jgi:hypothetical protein
MDKVKAFSQNCSSCGREVLNYQIRPTKVGSILIDCCPSCGHLNEAYKQFKQAVVILKDINKSAQEMPNPQTASPNIIIEPIDSNIQAAVQLLKRMDGNYFAGVSKIVAGAEANYGHVSSEHPDEVNINLSRISNETKGDNSKRAIVSALAVTIAHEVAHVKSWDGKTFIGGESVALAEENKVTNWIKANESRLQDLFK